MKKLVTLFILLFSCGLTPAQTVMPHVTPINVVYLHHPVENVLDKIAMNVWVETASTLNLKYVFLPTDQLPQAMQWLREGKARLIIGAVPAGATQSDHDYIINYIPNETGVVLTTRSHFSILARMGYIAKGFIGGAILVVLLYVFIFGCIIWLIERRPTNGIFPKHPRGLMDSFWFSFTTFTTLCYGDFVPKTPLGRAMTVFWICVSLVLGSTFIGAITSDVTNHEMQLVNITSLSELHGKKVAYLQHNNVARDDILEYHAIPTAQADWPSFFTALDSKTVNAGFADRIISKDQCREHADSNVKLSDLTINHGAYTFITKRNDPLENEVSRILYTLNDIGVIPRIVATQTG